MATDSKDVQTSSTEQGSLREESRRVYRFMLEARLMEAKFGSLYRAGKVLGGVYLGKGQEAVSAALGSRLTKGKDVFAPLIRDQAGRMAFGEEPLDAIRTYLGSSLGPMRGRDGNIHRGRPSEGMLAMISHLGAQIAVMAGVLFARRMKGELGDSVGASCIGDGGTSTGAFHEAMNMIGVEKLPVVMVVANNQFAYSTPNSSQFACDNLISRAPGYGFAAHSVDGTSLIDCVEVMGRAVTAARAGEGPQMVEAHLLRLAGHGEHDDGAYVPEEIRNSPYGRDCMEVGQAELEERGWVESGEIEHWSETYSAELQSWVAQVQREDGPDPRVEPWEALSSLQHADRIW